MMSLQKELTLTQAEEADVEGVSSAPAFLRIYLEKRNEGRRHQKALEAAKQEFSAAWC